MVTVQAKRIEVLEKRVREVPSMRETLSMIAQRRISKTIILLAMRYVMASIARCIPQSMTVTSERSE
ncbi:hypothetical protein [Cohnella sp.]|uniref:hypothetical protein n=1 Tax=Cohnella sp. TaxID=1883426 RepID=UPI0035620BFE